jgi:hypothetical protein
MAANSAFAAANFSPSNRLNLAATGGPVVTMWWHTPCEVAGSFLDGLTTSGKLSNSDLKEEGGPQVATCGTAAADPGGAFTAAAATCRDEEGWVKRSDPAAGSTRRRK